MASPLLVHEHGPRFDGLSAHAISCAILPGMPLDRWWDGMIRARSSAGSGVLIVLDPSWPHLMLWLFPVRNLSLHSVCRIKGSSSSAPCCSSRLSFSDFALHMRCTMCGVDRCIASDTFKQMTLMITMEFHCRQEREALGKWKVLAFFTFSTKAH